MFGRVGNQAAQHSDMVPRVRHGAAAARGVGGAGRAPAQRGVEPARGQEVPGSCALHHGEYKYRDNISVAYDPVEKGARANEEVWFEAKAKPKFLKNGVTRCYRP